MEYNKKGIQLKGISEEYIELSTENVYKFVHHQILAVIFFNYKGTNSLVLLVVVDDDYYLSFINIGTNGRCSDDDVFQDSSIFNDLEINMLPVGTFLVGDAIFPLKIYLLNLCQHSSLTYE